MATKKSPAKTSSKQLKAGKKKSLNKWIVLAGVVAIAIIGVVVVRYSNASSYAFIHRTNKMSGGKISQKSDGVTYRVVSTGQGVATFVSAAELKGTTGYCVHFKLISETAKLNLSIGNGQMGGGMESGTFSGVNSTHYLCLRSSGGTGEGTGVLGVSPINGTIGVDTFYGTR